MHVVFMTAVQTSLFLKQEPTSGLDYSTAFSLVRTMRSITEAQNKTVIMTIHQPSSQMFFSFHNLLLLCDGQVGVHCHVGTFSCTFNSSAVWCLFLGGGGGCLSTFLFISGEVETWWWTCTLYEGAHPLDTFVYITVEHQWRALFSRLDYIFVNLFSVLYIKFQ